MLLSTDSTGSSHRIVDYTENQLRLAQVTIEQPTLLTATQRLPLTIRSRNELPQLDLKWLTQQSIHILLYTAPEPLVWPDQEWRAILASHHIGLEVLSIGAAARTFNLLLSDHRPVALLALLGLAPASLKS
jgi:uncharacterized protein